MRAEIMKQAVLQEEVDSKLFFAPTMAELHKYFDAHKEKFRKPESDNHLGDISGPRRKERTGRQSQGRTAGGSVARGRGL